MAYVSISINHRRAPVELLERTSVAAHEIDKVLDTLVRFDAISEAAVVSTCNRTEIYARVERFHPAYDQILGLIADRADRSVDEIEAVADIAFDGRVATHMFRVAAGLESDVLGEHEILGQLARAHRAAVDHGACGRHLDRLFRRALEAGKAVRTETGIGRHAASVSSVAARIAIDRLGGLAGRSVVVIGAGEAARRFAVALTDAQLGSIVVANRTPSNARALADEVGATVAGLERLPELVASADLVLSAVGVDRPVLGVDQVRAAIASRPCRQLVIVDVALPRSFEAGVADLPGVSLVGLDDLRSHAAAGRAHRAASVELASDLVEAAATAFGAETQARELDPMMTALYMRSEALRSGEVERAINGQLAGLDAAERDAVHQLTRRIVAKLLHQPVATLKNSAGTPRGSRLADAAVELWELP